MKTDIGNIPELPKFNLKNSDWKDGAVVRSPNWLGDAIMTLPAMLQLRRLIPEKCGLFVVCPPSLEDFFKALPIVDVVQPLHKAHKAWSKEDKMKVRKLQAGVCLMFNNSLRDAIYFKAAKVPKLFGAAARCRGVLMTKAWKFPKRLNCEFNKLHHAAKYLSMSIALGAPEWTGDMPEFVVNKERELIDKKILALFDEPRLMTLAPGAAYGEAKRWPSEYFNKVANRWVEDGGSVAVLGTAKERKIGDLAIQGLPDDKAFNMAGKTDLSELMLTLQNAQICVANDSGTMHLAAALGTKGIAVFGSTDPSATSPVSSSRWDILFEKQECAPCFKRECPKTEERYSCLRAITPERVIELAKEITA